MNSMKVFSIGRISNKNGNVSVTLEPKYAAGLKGLADYGYAQIIWWLDGCDNQADRNTLVECKPYKNGPEQIGVFALRSPERPNPIAVSNAFVTYVDEKSGTVGLAYIDANDGSTVLDIKPYTPSLDRVERPITPSWCHHWPQSVEDSGDFDWDAEFNF